MKYLRPIMIVVTIFCAVGIILGYILLSYLSLDQISRSYSTLADAQIDIEKGWIPPIVPPSTYAIKDSHDLDLNTGTGSFEFDPKEMSYFNQHGMIARTNMRESVKKIRTLQDLGYQFGTYTEDKTTWLLALHPSGNGFYWMQYEN